MNNCSYLKNSILCKKNLILKNISMHMPVAVPYFRVSLVTPLDPK